MTSKKMFWEEMFTNIMTGEFLTVEKQHLLLGVKKLRMKV
jgi:hypothetical protein